MISGTRGTAGTLDGQRTTIIAGSVAAVALGGLAAVQPLAAIAAAGVIAGGLLVGLNQRLGPVFLGILAFVLAGYAFLGRGFAYLGVPPLFIGEMLLGVAVLALAVNVRRWRLNLMTFLLLLFMAWGVLSTIPYLTIHGIDALRDAVLWGYAIFAFAVAWTIQRQHFETMTRWYGKLLPVFIVWTPLALIAFMAIDGIPAAPGSDVPLLYPKGGDIAVHLTGAAAFLLLGLWARRSEIGSLAEFLLWPAWFAGLALAGSLNRGGLISAAVGVTITLLLRPTRSVVTAIIAATLLLCSVILINPTVDLGTQRQVSLEQIASNMKSVIWDTGDNDLSGTREWRLRWWGDIVDYTVHGPYFWTGKGFGVNLADVDGYQVMDDGSLRSPHNSHMSVLARMGVPGMVVWVALQVTFGVMLVSSMLRARRRHNTFWLQINIWLLVYWLAMLVNSSFDVYLEGPQAGIWFWTIFGLGLAAYRIQHDEASTQNVDNPGAPPRRANVFHVRTQGSIAPASGAGP